MSVQELRRGFMADSGWNGLNRKDGISDGAVMLAFAQVFLYDYRTL